MNLSTVGQCIDRVNVVSIVIDQWTGSDEVVSLFHWRGEAIS